MPARTWLLIDVPFFTWREFYGAARQDPRAAIVGALHEVRKLHERFSAHATTVYCFDRAPYFRTDVYPRYKISRETKERTVEEREGRAAVRTKTNELVETLRARNKHVLCYAGLEADDHIAAAARAIPKGDHAVICSRDQDLWQLLSPRCSALDPVTDQIHTHKTFRATYDLHPSEWAQVKALAGCATDDIDGIEGVGEKTAVKYLTGKMNRLSPLHGKIRNFIGTAPHLTNLALCSLPWPGTPPVPLESKIGTSRAICGGVG